MATKASNQVRELYLPPCKPVQAPPNLQLDAASHLKRIYWLFASLK
jgi:hypothetical protein